MRHGRHDEQLMLMRMSELTRKTERWRTLALLLHQRMMPHEQLPDVWMGVGWHVDEVMRHGRIGWDSQVELSWHWTEHWQQWRYELAPSSTACVQHIESDSSPY